MPSQLVEERLPTGAQQSADLRVEGYGRTLVELVVPLRVRDGGRREWQERRGEQDNRFVQCKPRSACRMRANAALWLSHTMATYKYDAMYAA
jgi:hypothetical protein